MKNETADVTFIERERIKPVDLNGKSDEKIGKYYWGIGISSRSIFDVATGSYKRIVTEIASGYNAERDGLNLNDVIIMVDNMLITDDNDVRGDGPRKMILTISRKVL